MDEFIESLTIDQSKALFNLLDGRDGTELMDLAYDLRSTLSANLKALGDGKVTFNEMLKRWDEEYDADEMYETSVFLQEALEPKPTPVTDLLIRKNVYLKQEAAIARLALQLICRKCGYSEDELLEVAGYQEEDLTDLMQKLQAEADEDAAKVVGVSL